MTGARICCRLADKDRRATTNSGVSSRARVSPFAWDALAHSESRGEMKSTSLKRDKQFFKVLKSLRIGIRKEFGFDTSNADLLFHLNNRGFPRAGGETKEAVYARYLGRTEEFEHERSAASKRITEYAKRVGHEATLKLQKTLKPTTFARKIGAPHPDYVRDDKFYETREWRELRYLALRNTDGRCQCCGGSAKDGLRIHVDHIQPRYKRPDLSLCLDNLQVLCEDCNFGKGAWDATDWRNK